MLLVIGTMLIGSASALAQVGQIGMYGDPLDLTPELDHGQMRFYVVHVGAGQTAGSQWSAPFPSCANLSWLADDVPFPVKIGTTQTGIAVAYGACLSGNILVATIIATPAGPAPTCCEWPILPDPVVPEGEIVIIDCANNEIFVGPFGAQGIIGMTPDCYPWPTERTTWGEIKALRSQ